MIDKESLKEIEIVPLIDTLRLQKIDDDVYFSKKYEGYISNSRLSLINPGQDNDPKAFFEGLSKHNTYSDSLTFGSAVHELILQPEYFHVCDAVERPTSKAGFMSDILYSTFKRNGEYTDDDIIAASNEVNYYKDKMNPDRIQALRDKCDPYFKQRLEYEKTDYSGTPIYLNAKSRERVCRCVDSLKKDKHIQELLHPKGLINDPISENEQAILLDVQVTIKESFILRIKAKLDNYTIDQDTNIVTVNDVKTVGISDFNANFNRFHYYRELAIYSWLISLAAKKYYNMDDCTIKSNCLVVSTIPNFYTSVYPLKKIDFYKGWEEFKYLLRLVAYYYNEGYRFGHN